MGQCDQCCHRSIDGFDSLIPVVGSARVTAASVLASNISAELYKNGDIIISQQPAANMWDDLIDGGTNVATDIYGRTGKNNYAVISWDKGAYAYMKPQSTLDLGLDQVDVSFNSNGDAVGIGFSPYTCSPYLLVYIQTNTPATTPSTLVRYVVSTVVQWTSRNAMFPGEMSLMRPSLQMDLIHGLVNKEQFFENPLHILALLPIIKAVLAGITAVGGAVGATAGAYSAVRTAIKG
jgi:hypothetical protein